MPVQTANYSPEGLLSYVPLTKSVEEIKTGIPKVFPDSFWSLTEDISGDAAEYVVYKGTRQTARALNYGAPPRQTAKSDISTQKIKLIHTSEEIQFQQELFKIFRDWENYKPQQHWAAQQLAYQGRNFRTRFDNLRVAVVSGMLANGKVWFDANGNLLPSSSGADLTIDQGIPSANIGTLSAQGVVTTAWSDPAANIPTQINNLKMLARQRSGYQLKYAFYGKNVAGWMASNTSMQAYFSRNPTRNQQWVDNGTIPDGVLDLTWIPVQDSFFEDQNGAVQEIFPADQITFFPEITSATYAFYQGSVWVPTTYGIMPDTEAALASLKEAYGIFRYAQLTTKPVAIFDVVGDTFLPRFKVPGSVFIIDTTP